jgi:aspartyl-tRNA(Asn)/glutamyl-tRNA(Gln) amidotransferase subunit B
MSIDIKTYDPANHADWVRRLHQYIKEEGIRAWNDPAELEPLVIEVLTENPKQVEAYRKGKTKIIGFFFQKLMEKTKSGANPEISQALLEKHLAPSSSG